MKKTTISLTWDNLEKLRQHGNAGDSMNDVLSRILEQIENKEPIKQ
jgi:hypothetical protein